MEYLLDTQILLWWLTTPEKISKKAQEIIKDKSNIIYISSASFMEMAIKKKIGRLTLPHNLIETIAAEDFKTLPITPEESLGIADLTILHADLFDRLLIIQAKLHSLIIITHDPKISGHPIATLEA